MKYRINRWWRTQKLENEEPRIDGCTGLKQKLGATAWACILAGTALLPTPAALALERSAAEAHGQAKDKRAAQAEAGLPAPVDAVDPFIGTSGHGHTFPGATVPYGMVQMSPDTRNGTWDGCSGYHWSDSAILGFSHTHLSGTGCGDLGDILFIPTLKPIDMNDAGFDYKNYKIPFSHNDESARPGYYSVKLSDIKAELTSTRRAGLHRYTFKQTKEARIIIDLAHGISDEPLESSLNIVNADTVTGLRRSRGWAKNQYVYFAAKFSKPITGFGTICDGKKPEAGSRQAGGKKVSGWLNFDSSDGKPIVAKVGLSSVSVEAALKNLQAEVPDWDFDRVSKEARDAWNKQLSRIRIKTDNAAERRTFYTALYHCFIAPNLVSDLDGGYRGSDSEVHKADGFENYSTFSLWDTFRAEHTLLAILEPGRVNDFIKSFQVQAQHHEKKVLPIWPLASNETYCMIGYHSFPVIAEAYAKGIRSWDAEALFKLMVENTKRNDWWAAKGYIPADKEQESVSKTLEFAYDDWCLAEFAAALGHKDESEKFAGRAEAFKNVFDKTSGFMRGRLADGSWRTPFDPTEVVEGGPRRDFTEANAWQYSFFVPQDVTAMVELYGGRKNFVEKLDEMFKTQLKGPISLNDVSGLIGQYAQGNEPSHHVAYLYSYAGAPEKTAERIKQIRDTLYTSATDGLCGNEDCGQMSAWYVFSALGFYPVNPVQGLYVLGTPAFANSTVNLPGGKEFKVVAHGLSDKNIYIARAALNGKPLDKVYFSHNDLKNGGLLELTMTDKPGLWGSAKSAAPPALLK